jgi:hypothetical protein
MYCDTCISALLFGGVISYLEFLTLLEILGSGVLIGGFWGILEAGLEKHLLFSFFPILHACRYGAKETMQRTKTKVD